MTVRTVLPADYIAYLESEFPAQSDGAVAARAADAEERRVRLAAFPFSVMLQVAYPELDYANRWCWRQFGPAHGECWQSSSVYPACDLPEPHAHVGRWLTHWLAKTDYDFGFNEWYFASEPDRDRFVEFIPHLHWGERYAK
ncbi:MAG: hypothetical protein ACRDD1_20625 [Planctomycetia bacterium]